MSYRKKLAQAPYESNFIPFPSKEITRWSQCVADNMLIKQVV